MYITVYNRFCGLCGVGPPQSTPQTSNIKHCRAPAGPIIDQPYHKRRLVDDWDHMTMMSLYYMRLHIHNYIYRRV